MPNPEDNARENIDRLLTQAGWAVRDQSEAIVIAYIYEVMIGAIATSKDETWNKLKRNF